MGGVEEVGRLEVLVALVVVRRDRRRVDVEVDLRVGDVAVVEGDGARELLLKAPCTVEIIMCFTPNPTWVWAASMSQSDASAEAETRTSADASADGNR